MPFKKKKSQELTEEELKQQNREKTAQQWMPIADIDNNIVYRKDDLLVGMIRVQPVNIDLLSDAEKKRKIESLTEEWNGEKEGFQIFSIGRPVDLNSYLEWLQQIAREEQDFTRKKILRGYIQQASRMASNGEATERRFYIIITKKAGKKAEDELKSRLNEMRIKLSSAELTADICTDDEIVELYSLFAYPAQASFEQNYKTMYIPTQLDI